MNSIRKGKPRVPQATHRGEDALCQSLYSAASYDKAQQKTAAFKQPEANELYRAYLACLGRGDREAANVARVRFFTAARQQKGASSL